MTNIHVRKAIQYGTVRRYPTDAKQAAALQMLTGRITLTETDISALVALGHSVSEQSDARTWEPEGDK